ncbi:MAG TPA: hypothetical protein VGR43_02315 [Dehalococcoidia bacterium]|nr:hypothetical protein [Dehalococcoidia bacterium]
MDLAKVGWRRTEWSWQSGANPQPSNGSWLLRFENVDLPEGVYEVAQLGISTGDPNATHDILHFKGREGAFPRVYVAISESSLPLISHSVLRDRAAAIERERRRYWFRGTVANPEDPGIGRFTACVLLTRCLLTSNLRLEDVDLLPLRVGLTGTEELMHLNTLLAELGFGPRIPHEGEWVQIKMRDFPLAAIRFRLIWASTLEQASKFVESLTSAILAVLSGHRMARGEVIATVVQSLDFLRATYKPGYPQYQGNLMGGFLSGEDPGHIEQQLARVRKDPTLDLFSSLHSESIAEREPNFAYFRYWNLLEAIATRRILGGNPVIDFAGVAITNRGGQQVTTSGARARVYELLRRHFTKRHASETTFATLLGGKSLWEMSGAWIAFRNATAHFGAFRRHDKFQQSHLRDWKAAEAGYDDIIGRGAEFGALSDPYLTLLKESARFIVSWEIDGQTV